MRWPVAIRSVAPATPTTAGMPYSRATTAPCDIIPPISITSPPAVRKSGVHRSGVDPALPHRGRAGDGDGRGPPRIGGRSDEDFAWFETSVMGRAHDARDGGHGPWRR